MKYVYVYLDPRKPGNYIYDNYCFDMEPFYIGIGTRNDRMFAHLKEAKCSLKNSYKLNKIRAILNSGQEPVIRKLIEGLSDDEYKLIEIDLIEKIGRDSDGGPLCNLSKGGDGGIGGATTTGRKLTEEHKKKISLSGKGKKKPVGFGKKISDIKKNVKLGTYEEQFGIEKASERKNKLSNINVGSKNPFYGKTHTDETKKIISTANLGRKHTEESKIKRSAASKLVAKNTKIHWNSKKILATNQLDNTKIIFNSCIECALFLNSHKVYISKMINEKKVFRNYILQFC